MKKFKVTILALMGLAFVSCQDAVDIVQGGELYPETAFQTVDDLQLGLVGVYGVMPGETEIGFNAIFTDEVRIGYANGGQGLIQGEYGFILNTNSGDAASIWFSYYRMLMFTNRVLEAAGTIVPSGDDETAQYKDVIAQLHILRAWAHFKLLCYFSTDLTDDNALGVILGDHPIAVTGEYLPRVTNGEVFALINSDLDYVTDLTSNADNADNKFISPDFVKAFRARMAAFRGDYATVLTLTNELIADYPLTQRGTGTSPAGPATVTSANSNYMKLWADLDITNGSDEIIFKLDRVLGDSEVGGIFASVNATADGSPFYEMSTDLFNLLNVPGDVRFNAFVHPTSTNSPDLPNNGVYAIGKYTGSAGIALLNDLKVFRTSEMVFLKAEAQAATGDLVGVAATLQTINAARFRNNAPVIAVPATAQAAYAEILKQRRIELCFEGHRYLDLKRLGARAGVDIVRNPLDCAINGACTLSTSDYRFTMPIPSSELSANPTVRSQQNPGYSVTGN
ncbi:MULTISPECIES: RagB/SusD family nutrient uptake outer membrane protein [unclassified Flavobacterium]|uniref:RagB/SusD family nutrient uptake outer membrane protein n=1 Tax=unclassified Flavobacterium TaxID=196869 RepID=UPI001F143156|nr:MULTISPECIES: RagB/SusD family nutrient uptake outer membrane protein [unclassified Flavobacterium]UMY66956.1 RagB/SusD family nutrient uptake outer membrane protein [Flavobacterium sp. HJ-32-4]